LYFGDFDEDIIDFLNSYIQYSAVCARTLRRCLKTSVAKEAMKREESYIRVSKWQGGKLTEQVYPTSKSIQDNYLTNLLFFSFIETEQTS
jgi:hypothetical protein